MASMDQEAATRAFEPTAQIPTDAMKRYLCTLHCWLHSVPCVKQRQVPAFPVKGMACTPYGSLTDVIRQIQTKVLHRQIARTPPFLSSMHRWCFAGSSGNNCHRLAVDRQSVHLEFEDIKLQAPITVGEHELPTTANSVRRGFKVSLNHLLI